MKRLLLATAAIAALGLTAAQPTLADAVSQLNGKITAGAGAVGPVDVYGGGGSIDVPLGGSWGAQGDLYAGGISGITTIGGAGHLFWRDPVDSLFGLYVSDQHFDLFGGVDVTKVGGEAELYLSDSWTARTLVGWEGGDVKDRVFDRTEVIYYPSDNWSVTAGHRYTLGINAGVLGTTYQFAGTNFAVSLLGRIGEFRTSGAFLSLTYFFGEQGKPLAARARQDDPVDSLSDDALSAEGSGGIGACDVGLNSAFIDHPPPGPGVKGCVD